MQKTRVFDFLIIVLLYIALSCFPFGLIIKDEKLSWLILALEIVVQVGLFVFILLFSIFKSSLDYKNRKINVINTLLLIPTLAVCFSNLVNLRIANESIQVAANWSLFLHILLTNFVVINEEIIFRLLLINNLEFNNKLFVILLSAGLFGFCHISHFLSTFNPADLLIIVYTFLLGLLLSFAYLFSNSIYPCVAIHLLFNLLNNILFPYFTLNWVYILISALFAVGVAIYIAIILIIKTYKKNTSNQHS